MAQYVFTMNRVGKIVPPKRQILKDITLSFFPGAKIGVLGVNGSGKSTFLKIMAGVDKDIEGEAVPMPGIKVGFLPQAQKLAIAAQGAGEFEILEADGKTALVLRFDPKDGMAKQTKVTFGGFDGDDALIQGLAPDAKVIGVIDSGVASARNAAIRIGRFPAIIPTCWRCTRRCWAVRWRILGP